VRESIRKLDAMEAEDEYTKAKYKDKVELIDTEAQNCFSKAQSMCSIKCSYGFNHYATRDKVINYGLVSKECPRCSRKETWCYIVQCNEILDLKVDFILDLKSKLIKTKYPNVIEKEIDFIIRDAR